MEAFNSALRQVLEASKSDLKRLLAKDAASKVGKPKRGPKPKVNQLPPKENHTMGAQDDH
jgi:hypothetical protein